MDWLADNLPNVVALLFVVAVIGLAIWGVMRGGAGDCSSCAGDCGSCHGACTNPQLRLSKDQLDQLDEIDRKYGVSK